MRIDVRGSRLRRHARRRTTALCLAGAWLLVTTAGCATVAGQASVAAGANVARVAVSTDAPPPAAPTTVTATKTYTETVTPEVRAATDPAPTDDGTVTVTAPAPSSADDQLYEETAAAVGFTEGFWNDTFDGWDVVWHGPSLWGGNGFYDSATRDRSDAEWWAEGPYCGERAPEYNAFFCHTGEVAWDRVLMEDGYTAIGHAFVYVVVAHEWGHAAQQRFIADGEAPAVLAQQELQADCLAGTTIAGAADLGYLELEIGDTEELTATLLAMGDERAWRTSDDHGSSAERVSWFRTGFDGGIEACLGNA